MDEGTGTQKMLQVHRLIGGFEHYIDLGLTVLDMVRIRVRSFYHTIAGFYDKIAPVWADWGYSEAYVALDRAYTGYLPEGGHVLDLGCGTGANLEQLLSLHSPFGSYTGVDSSEAMLARARSKFGSLNNVQFEQLDVAADPLPDGPFDLIVSTWVFEHLAEPTRVAAEAWKKLRPGGHMVLLFEVKTSAWCDLLIDRVWHFFSAHLLREDEYRHIPGLLSVRQFHSLGPTLALLISHKPEKPDGMEIGQIATKRGEQCEAYRDF
ncbi:MAG: class I SAM-dependent methyltransferase [Anaerolineae bacterium]